MQPQPSAPPASGAANTHLNDDVIDLVSSSSDSEDAMTVPAVKRSRPAGTAGHTAAADSTEVVIDRTTDTTDVSTATTEASDSHAPVTAAQSLTSAIFSLDRFRAVLTSQQTKRSAATAHPAPAPAAAPPVPAAATPAPAVPAPAARSAHVFAAAAAQGTASSGSWWRQPSASATAASLSAVVAATPAVSNTTNTSLAGAAYAVAVADTADAGNDVLGNMMVSAHPVKAPAKKPAKTAAAAAAVAAAAAADGAASAAKGAKATGAMKKPAAAAAAAFVPEPTAAAATASKSKGTAKPATAVAGFNNANSVKPAVGKFGNTVDAKSLNMGEGLNANGAAPNGFWRPGDAPYTPSARSIKRAEKYKREMATRVAARQAALDGLSLFTVAPESALKFEALADRARGEIVSSADAGANAVNMIDTDDVAIVGAAADAEAVSRKDGDDDATAAAVTAAAAAAAAAAADNEPVVFFNTDEDLATAAAPVHVPVASAQHTKKETLPPPPLLLCPTPLLVFPIVPPPSLLTAASLACFLPPVLSLTATSPNLSVLTPLERQVRALKLAHPSLVLFFEVGYRYRLFGPDAQIAAALLHVQCVRDGEGSAAKPVLVSAGPTENDKVGIDAKARVVNIDVARSTRLVWKSFDAVKALKMGSLAARDAARKEAAKEPIVEQLDKPTNGRYMAASVPTVRGNIALQAFLKAGYKVGIVRQRAELKPRAEAKPRSKKGSNVSQSRVGDDDENKPIITFDDDNDASDDADDVGDGGDKAIRRKNDSSNRSDFQAHSRTQTQTTVQPQSAAEGESSWGVLTASAAGAATALNDTTLRSASGSVLDVNGVSSAGSKKGTVVYVRYLERIFSPSTYFTPPSVPLALTLGGTDAASAGAQSKAAAVAAAAAAVAAAGAGADSGAARWVLSLIELPTAHSHIAAHSRLQGVPAALSQVVHSHYSTATTTSGANRHSKRSVAVAVALCAVDVVSGRVVWDVWRESQAVLAQGQAATTQTEQANTATPSNVFSDRTGLQGRLDFLAPREIVLFSLPSNILDHSNESSDTATSRASASVLTPVDPLAIPADSPLAATATALELALSALPRPAVTVGTAACLARMYAPSWPSVTISSRDSDRGSDHEQARGHDPERALWGVTGSPRGLLAACARAQAVGAWGELTTLLSAKIARVRAEEEELESRLASRLVKSSFQCKGGKTRAPPKLIDIDHFKYSDDYEPDASSDSAIDGDEVFSDDEDAEANHVAALGMNGRGSDSDDDKPGSQTRGRGTSASLSEAASAFARGSVQHPDSALLPPFAAAVFSPNSRLLTVPLHTGRATSAASTATNAAIATHGQLASASARVPVAVELLPPAATAALFPAQATAASATEATEATDVLVRLVKARLVAAVTVASVANNIANTIANNNSSDSNTSASARVNGGVNEVRSNSDAVATVVASLLSQHQHSHGHKYATALHYAAMAIVTALALPAPAALAAAALVTHLSLLSVTPRTATTVAPTGVVTVAASDNPFAVSCDSNNGSGENRRKDKSDNELWGTASVLGDAFLAAGAHILVSGTRATAAAAAETDSAAAMTGAALVQRMAWHAPVKPRRTQSQKAAQSSSLSRLQPQSQAQMASDTAKRDEKAMGATDAESDADVSSSDTDTDDNEGGDNGAYNARHARSQSQSHVNASFGSFPLDADTIVNLSLLPSPLCPPGHSALDLLCRHARSPATAALLRAWLLRPLSAPALIRARHAAVAVARAALAPAATVAAFSAVSDRAYSGRVDVLCSRCESHSSTSGRANASAMSSSSASASADVAAVCSRSLGWLCDPLSDATETLLPRGLPASAAARGADPVAAALAYALGAGPAADARGAGPREAEQREAAVWAAWARKCLTVTRGSAPKLGNAEASAVGDGSVCAPPTDVNAPRTQSQSRCQSQLPPLLPVTESLLSHFAPLGAAPWLRRVRACLPLLPDIASALAAAASATPATFSAFIASSTSGVSTSNVSASPVSGNAWGGGITAMGLWRLLEGVAMLCDVAAVAAHGAHAMALVADAIERVCSCNKHNSDKVHVDSDVLRASGCDCDCGCRDDAAATELRAAAITFASGIDSAAVAQLRDAVVATAATLVCPIAPAVAPRTRALAASATTTVVLSPAAPVSAAAAAAAADQTAKRVPRKSTGGKPTSAARSESGASQFMYRGRLPNGRPLFVRRPTVTTVSDATAVPTDSGGSVIDSGNGMIDVESTTANNTDANRNRVVNVDETCAAVAEATTAVNAAAAATAAAASPSAFLLSSPQLRPVLHAARARLASAEARLRGLLALVRRALGPGYEQVEWTAVSGEEWLIEIKRSVVDGKKSAVSKAGKSRATLAGDAVLGANAGVVEEPIDVAAVLSQWERVSTTQKVVRYRPPAVGAALTELSSARLAVAAAAADALALTATGVAARVGPAARRLLQSVLEIDAIAALAQLAAEEGYVKPRIVAEVKSPRDDTAAGSRVMARDLRHAMVESLMKTEGKGYYVPNDCVLGWDLPPTTDKHHEQSSNQLHDQLQPNLSHQASRLSGFEWPSHARALVVTGPNMGGKSSYCRSLALAVILAQCGSFVPASSFALAPVDSVLTRMGASDSILTGKSTFYTELSETSRILATATPRSLVLLDELGRGTSTHDGTALAWAVLSDLRDRSRCLTLFTTHYPLLGRLALAPPQGLVSNCHVAFVERTSSNTGGAHNTVKLQPSHSQASLSLSSQESAVVGSRAKAGAAVSFLYRVRGGLCPRSFGLHVARLAGLPPPVLAAAAAASARAEDDARARESSRAVAVAAEALAALKAAKAALSERRAAQPSGDYGEQEDEKLDLWVLLDRVALANNMDSNSSCAGMKERVAQALSTLEWNKNNSGLGASTK